MTRHAMHSLQGFAGICHRVQQSAGEAVEQLLHLEKHSSERNSPQVKLPSSCPTCRASWRLLCRPRPSVRLLWLKARSARALCTRVDHPRRMSLGETAPEPGNLTLCPQHRVSDGGGPEVKTALLWLKGSVGAPGI